METLQREAAAYHEAGHAVFAWRYGYWVREGGLAISEDGSGSAAIRTEVFPGVLQRLPVQSKARRFLEAQARAEAEISLAGPQAERRALRLRGLWIRPPELDAWEGWWLAYQEGEPLADIDEAARVLGELLPAGEITVALKRARDRVTRLLRHPRTWAAVEVLAKALLSEGRLSAESAEALIKSTSPPRQVAVMT